MSATRSILKQLNPSPPPAILSGTSPVLPEITSNETSPLLSRGAGVAEEDDDPIVINTADHVTQPELEEEFVWDWPRIFLSFLTTGDVLLEPLFAYFLYDTIKELGEAVLKEFGAEATLPWLLIIFNIIAGFLVINNMVGKVSTMDFVEDVQRLLEKNEPIAENNRAAVAGRIFTYINRGLALPTAGIFAASDAIAIAYLSENLIIRWLAGGLVTGIGLVAFHIFAANTIKNHSEEFVNRLVSHNSTTTKAIMSPLKALEVFIESLALMGYKSIGAGFTIHQLLKRVVGLPENNLYMLPSIMAASALAFYTTGFSATSPIHLQHFNPRWNQLTPAELAMGKTGVSGWIKDTLLASTRGIGVGWLLQRFIPGDAALKFGLAVPVGALLSLHKLYVLHRKRRRENAYHLHEEELIRSGRVTLTPEELNDAAKLFDKIAAHYKTPRFKRIMAAINIGSGTAKWVAFVAFLTALQKTLEQNNIPIPFTLLDKFFLALAVGTTTVLADQAGAKPARDSVVSYLYAKAKIGPPTKKIAEACALSKTMQTLYFPRKHYNKEVLKRIEEDLEQKDRQAYQQLP